MSKTTNVLSDRLGEVLSEYGVHNVVDGPTFDRLTSKLTYVVEDQQRLIGPAVVHVPRLENKGYCWAGGMNDYVRVNGRKYDAGFAKDSRAEHGGPIVPGWHGWMNQASVVVATSYPQENIVEANLGDLLVGPENTLWRIIVEPRHGGRRVEYLALERV